MMFWRTALGMRSRCVVTRNSLSLRPQMASKANPFPEQSLAAVGARDGGDRRWFGDAFPDLSALLRCCGLVCFTGFGATLEDSTTLVSVLSH